MGPRKAQVSAESVIIFAFMLMVLSLVAVSALYRQNEAAAAGLSMSLDGECRRFSDAIASAFSSGNGTSVTIETGYGITVSAGGVVSVRDSRGNIAHCLAPVNASKSQELSGRIAVRNADGNVSLGVVA